MLNKFRFIILLFGMLLGSCSGKQGKSASELLNDPVMEEDIYNSIMSDNQHLEKLMNKMMTDENCRKMLTSKGAIMKMMCMSEELDSMLAKDNELMERLTSKMFERMKRDSIVCDHTCSRMMENEQFRNYLKKYKIEKR